MLVMKNTHFYYQERYTGYNPHGQKGVECTHCGHYYNSKSPKIKLISDQPNFLGWFCKHCEYDYWEAKGKRSEFIEVSVQ